MKKINNKGFTLTELLATIAILALVAVIATPAVIGVSNSIKKNMFESKQKLIMRAAALAGEDVYADDDLYDRMVNRLPVELGYSYDPSKKCIAVKHLLQEGYIECDYGKYDASSKEICIKNPKNNEDMINCEVEITNTNGRITTSWYSVRNPNCN